MSSEIDPPALLDSTSAFGCILTIVDRRRLGCFRVASTSAEPRHSLKTRLVSKFRLMGSDPRVTIYPETVALPEEGKALLSH